MAAASHWLMSIGTGSVPTPPPPIPGALNLPNPGETTWRLGVGGVPVQPRVRAGWDLVLTTTLYNNGVLLSYPPEAILEAVAWTGGGQPNAFFPQVQWDSAPAAAIRVAFPGTATASIEPGRYRFRVGLTSQGVRMVAYDGTLDVEASPGTASAGRIPYVTGEDLSFYYDKLPKFQNRDVDQAGFRAQCVEASDQHDRRLINGYMARPGYTKKRQPAYDPDLGYDVPDPTVAPPTKAQLTAWLAAGGLRVDAVAREIISRLAIALVLDRVSVQDGNNYRDEAQAQRDRADTLWRSYQAEVSSVPGSPPDWLIDSDATSLPAGAAP